LYDVKSGQLYQLTTNPNNDEAPSWARDSRHIAFSRVHNRTSRIMLLDSETGKTSPLINNGQYCGSPAWSP
ncbi:PD40 domain-containing protein, partial [bacterium]|nr:PD40 domain-containing protein [bacterium]